MLKRIREIQGIGTYVSCKAAGAELQKTTLIYGSNRSGKSTLCDIFRSLAMADAKPINERKTIPAAGSPTVQLSFGGGGKAESPVAFQDGKWQSALPTNLALSVFDSGFITRNLFTGADIDRKNKEALTQFVLGEQGVKNAETIAQQRKELGQKTKELKLLERVFVGVPSIGAFINMTIDEPETAIDDSISKINVDLAQKKQQLENAAKISARQELSTTRFVLGATDAAQRMAKALAMSLQTVHDEVRVKLDAHIKAHVANERTGLEWIRTGMALIAHDVCPFCGQAIGAEARDLYEVFRKSFDDTYTAKLDEMHSFLRDGFGRFQKYGSAGTAYDLALQSNQNCVESYPELSEDAEFAKLVFALRDGADALLATAQGFHTIWAPISEQMGTLSETKKQAPHIPIESPVLDDLRQCEDLLLAKVEQYNQLVGQVNGRLQEFKRTVQHAPLTRAINQLNVTLQTISIKKKRLQLDVSCGDHKELSEDIATLDAAVKKGQEELEKEQSDFLNKFFGRINHYFKKFGSNDFEIQTGEMDGKGHQPVITLNVKYKGSEIQASQLPRVFSESDRRALALSLFWAKLSVQVDGDKSNTIIVLDDPVTSFDDNRISVTMMEIQREMERYAQFIVLTHYPRFARYMLVDMRLQGKMAFLRLEKTMAGTSIVMGGEMEFIQSEHHKKYLKILSFIEGNRTIEIDSDLRVFMELEVHERFRDPIHKNQLENHQLGDLISELLRLGVLEKSVAERLDQFRINLNGPHHNWSSLSPDDWAALAKELIDFVYQAL